MHHYLLIECLTPHARTRPCLKKHPSIHPPLHPQKIQVNIIHDFATREEIARGSVSEGRALEGAADPRAVPDEQVGAAVIDCR